MHDRKTIQGCKVKKEQCTENININNQGHNINYMVNRKGKSRPAWL